MARSNGLGLYKYGYTMLAARNKRQAYEYFKDRDPDVKLSDVDVYSNDTIVMFHPDVSDGVIETVADVLNQISPETTPLEFIEGT